MRGWRHFVWAIVCGFAGVIVLLSVFIVSMNPYGNLPRILFSEHVIDDTNQRFQYPALIRSQRYDSIVIGASDSRLLHPRALERVFGGRFANLAMNAGLAYEQYRLASLFIREVKDRRTLLVGLDHVWCDEDAGEKRITFRGFPEWMYDDDWRNDLRYMLNAKSVEISGRRFGQALGLRKARFPDGYEVFTPAESAYDPVKVRGKLWDKGPNSAGRARLCSERRGACALAISSAALARRDCDEIRGPRGVRLRSGSYRRPTATRLEGGRAARGMQGAHRRNRTPPCGTPHRFRHPLRDNGERRQLVGPPAFPTADRRASRRRY